MRLPWLNFLGALVLGASSATWSMDTHDRVQDKALKQYIHTYRAKTSRFANEFQALLVPFVTIASLVKHAKALFAFHQGRDFEDIALQFKTDLVQAFIVLIDHLEENVQESYISNVYALETVMSTQRVKKAIESCFTIPTVPSAAYVTGLLASALYAYPCFTHVLDHLKHHALGSQLCAALENCVIAYQQGDTQADGIIHTQQIAEPIPDQAAYNSVEAMVLDDPAPRIKHEPVDTIKDLQRAIDIHAIKAALLMASRQLTAVQCGFVDKLTHTCCALVRKAVEKAAQRGYVALLAPYIQKISQLDPLGQYGACQLLTYDQPELYADSQTFLMAQIAYQVLNRPSQVPDQAAVIAYANRLKTLLPTEICSIVTYIDQYPQGLNQDQVYFLTHVYVSAQMPPALGRTLFCDTVSMGNKGASDACIYWSNAYFKNKHFN